MKRDIKTKAKWFCVYHFGKNTIESGIVIINFKCASIDINTIINKEIYHHSNGKRIENVQILRNEDKNGKIFIEYTYPLLSPVIFHSLFFEETSQP